VRTDGPWFSRFTFVGSGPSMALASTVDTQMLPPVRSCRGCPLCGCSTLSLGRTGTPFLLQAAPTTSRMWQSWHLAAWVMFGAPWAWNSGFVSAPPC
jgi:hypothetical protein